MDYDTLEEGRVALHLLERQLAKGNISNIELGDNNSVGSRQLSLNTTERRLLDQVPRDARLHYRKGSPLGLTVEELDDRGLLDGGGSVPSYYTSVKQRGRRPLEMKKRSSRLQERGTESMAKLMNGFFHVVRALVRRGLNIEEYLRQMDNEGRGMIDKKQFSGMLRNMGLPFGPRELTDITYRYTVPSSDQVDYESFLRDAGIFPKSYSNNGVEVEISSGSIDRIDIGMYSNVLMDVKRMLMESVQSLGKSFDDIFRMFAQWDHEGTGTVTATQFLRVLARLHIELSDQDQDFLVELLDTNAMGRVDFESLLNFCFAEKTNEIISPGGLSSSTRSFAAEDSAIQGETLSAISTEAAKNSGEQNSVSSGNASRRPHTATSSRTPTPTLAHTNLAGQNGEENTGAAVGSTKTTIRVTEIINSNGLAPLGGDGSNNSRSKRPLTASGRVSENSDKNKFISKAPLPQRASSDRHLVVELPDDVIDDDDDLMLLTPHSMYRQQEYGLNSNENLIIASEGFYNHGSYNGSYNGSVNDAVDLQDGASFNDNTLITDQDELYFGSPQGLPTNSDNRDLWNSNSLDGLTASTQNTHDSQQMESHSRHWQSGSQYIHPPVNGNERYNSDDYYYQHSQESHQHYSNNQAQPPNIISLNNSSGMAPASSYDQHSSYNFRDSSPSEPYEHLSLLATQTLKTVREMIIGRCRNGKSLKDIFQHFDRDGKMYFDATDFIKATSDLRIETSERVADIAISMIAIDGIDKVSYGEFKVFVIDLEHKTLVKTVLQQISQQLERQGREYQSWLYSIFWDEETALNGTRVDRLTLQKNGLVSANVFVFVLGKIGVKITSGDMDRLIARFDMHGQGKCSASRFLRMVQESSQWRHSEKVLALQEEAIEEAAILKMKLKEGIIQGMENVTLELIGMAEYLGIRVLSEKHLLWIASDALKAPLPMSWTVKRDNQGRAFFYNHITNQSRWDHPLDPHFRKLRDKYRQSEEESEEQKHNHNVGGNSNNSGNIGVAGGTNSNSSGYIYPYSNAPNSSISFGGMGAALHGPPLNIVLPRDTRPVMNDFTYSASELPNAYDNRPPKSQTSSKIRPASSNPSSRPGKVERPEVDETSRRQRPQSALPEKTKTTFPPTHLHLPPAVSHPPSPDTKPVWRDRTQASSELRTLYNATTAPANRPTSAPNYISDAVNKLSAAVAASGNNGGVLGGGGGIADANEFFVGLDTRKKYTPDGIYSAPYFRSTSAGEQGGVGSGNTKQFQTAQNLSSDSRKNHQHLHQYTNTISNSTGGLQLPPSYPYPNIGGGMNMNMNSTTNSNSKTRNKSAGSTRSSAVDRVINFGKDIAGYSNKEKEKEKERNAERERDRGMMISDKAVPLQKDELARNIQLAGMYDDNLLGKLDNIIIGKTESQNKTNLNPSSSSSASTSRHSKQSSRNNSGSGDVSKKSHSYGKGGIVII